MLILLNSPSLVKQVNTLLAKFSIKKLAIFSNISIFEQILTPIEKATEKALDEQKKLFSS